MKLIIKLLKYWISLIYWNNAPVDKVKKMQLRKFREVFEYARENSPFYKQFYAENGVSDLVIRTWDDVEKVPVVDKNTYRTMPFDSRMACDMNNTINIHTTSGSSGTPLSIAYSKEVDYTGHVRVFYMLHKVAHYTPFKRILMVSRYEQDDKFTVEKDLSVMQRLQKTFKLFRRDIVSIYDDPDTIISRIEEASPHILWSTPSAMEIVANRLMVLNKKLKVPYLFFTSENISDVQYQKFKEFLSDNIIDLYGAMESPSISYDVNRSGKSIIFTNSCLIEYVDRYDGQQGKEGSVVVTSLINKVMPFVRYNLKDYGPILDDVDFPNKVMGHITGRVDDILSFPDGSCFFHHQAYEMFMNFHECLQFKFLQIGDGPITLQLLPNPNYDKDYIIMKARERWNKRFSNKPLEIEMVDHFEIDKKSGKFKNIEKK